MSARLVPLTEALYEPAAHFLETRGDRPPGRADVRRRVEWFEWLAEAPEFAAVSDVPIGWALEGAGVEGVHLTTPFPFRFAGQACALLVSSNFFVTSENLGMPAFSLFRTFLRFRERMHLAATTANDLSGRLWNASRGRPIEDSRTELFHVGRRMVGLVEEAVARGVGGGTMFRRFGGGATRREVTEQLRERVARIEALEELRRWPVPAAEPPGRTGLWVTPGLVDWVCRNPLSPALIVRAADDARLVCVVRGETRGHRGQIREARFVAGCPEGDAEGVGQARALLRIARRLAGAVDTSVVALRGGRFGAEDLAAAGFRGRRRPDVPRWWLPMKGETRSPTEWVQTGIEEL